MKTKIVKTRKEHCCSGCNREIPTGTRVTSWVSSTFGLTHWRCNQCVAVIELLNISEAELLEGTDAIDCLRNSYADKREAQAAIDEIYGKDMEKF